MSKRYVAGFAGIIVLASLLIAGACSAGPEDIDAEKAADSVTPSASSTPLQTTALGSVQGALVNSYDSIELLTSAGAAKGNAIVTGLVVDSNMNAAYEGAPFTIVQLQVDRVLSGDLEAGQTIAILENGGLLSGRSKLNPDETSAPVEMAAEGVPVMKKGEHWLLFLGPYDYAPILSNGYTPLGVTQGKMQIDSGGVIRFTGSKERLDQPEFAVASAVEGQAADSVIARVSRQFGS